jgi:hypothetical protein
VNDLSEATLLRQQNLAAAAAARRV